MNPKGIKWLNYSIDSARSEKPAVFLALSFTGKYAAESSQSPLQLDRVR
jgi:hypothetical protein